MNVVYSPVYPPVYSPVYPPVYSPVRSDGEACCRNGSHNKSMQAAVYQFSAQLELRHHNVIPDLSEQTLHLGAWT